MSLKGMTKGTELEEIIDNMAKGEAMAATMYFSLACMAREKGLLDVAKGLEKIASDEARHSGLYSFINGNPNEDIFKILENLENEEFKAGDDIVNLADKALELGLKEVADKLREVAKEEIMHGNLLKVLNE
ncbi:MAG: hypothetical protein ACRCXT_07020, partial [Paraclostridium sp.]